MSDVTQSVSLDQLAAALNKAQQQVMGASKASTNPFFNSKYADLSSVWDACREALTSNGLSVVQLPGYEAGAARLTTVLLHVSGQWIGSTAGAPLPPKRSKDGKTETPPDAQSVGSALTYLRRYGLAAIAGVVQEDDDAESAVRGKAVRGSGAKDSTPTARPLDQVPPPLAEPEPDPLDPKEMVMPIGKHKGAKLGVLSSTILVNAEEWMRGAKRYANYATAIQTILKDRGGE